MSIESLAVVIASYRAGASGTLRPAHAKQQDHLASLAGFAADVLARGSYLHAVCAPTKRAIRRWITTPDEVHPKRAIEIRRRCRHGHRETERGRRLPHLCLHGPYVTDDQRGFH